MKKHIKRFLAGCLFVTAFFVLFPAQNCQAAGLEQTGASEYSVTVRWDLRENALRYLIYVGTCNADSRLYAAVDDSVMSIEIRDLLGGSRNYVRVDYEYEDESGAVRTKLAGYMAGARTLPDKVLNVRQTGWYDRAASCNISWDGADCADGYEYRIRNRKGKAVAAGNIKGGACTARINRIAASEVCTASVRAYITVGEEKIYGGWSSPCCIFAQPRVKMTFIPKKGLKVQWRRILGVSGYNVYVSWSGLTGYQKVKSVDSSRKSVILTRFDGKKLSKKTVCYVYVTAKKKAGKQILEGGRYFYQNTENEDTGYFS